MSSSEKELELYAGKSGGNNEYQDLRRLWKDAHPDITRQTSDQRVAGFWNRNKDNSTVVRAKIEELNLKIRTRRNPIQAAFLRQYQKKTREEASRPTPGIPSEPSRSERDECELVEDCEVSTSASMSEQPEKALSQNTELHINTLPEEPLGSECEESGFNTNTEQATSLRSEPLRSEREVFGFNADIELENSLPSEPLGSEQEAAGCSGNTRKLNSSRPPQRSSRKRKEHSKSNTSSKQDFAQGDQLNNTPAQHKCINEINRMNREIVELTRIKETGLFFTKEMSTKLKDLRTKADKLQSNLRKLRSNREAAIKSRVKRKQQMQSLKELLPDAGEILCRTKKGRPCLEEKQTGLTKAILDIVSRNCNADEKRRCETLLSNMRLKDLLAELNSMGFHISRQGLSLRFKPRNKQSIWGRRHVSTVNVKLAKASNTLRKKHSDTHFAAGTIRFLHDIAELYGKQSVMVVSVDDKAKVPLGITAAKSRSPILMRMDYEVRLPDHDFVVGTGHKLTPSVYAGLEVKAKKLTYSGPTLIAIRSGKHDSSTAESHANDMDRFLSLRQFDYFTKFGGELKPIMIIFTDGGPDENPRFPKTLKQAIRHFKRYNLDALFIATNAPGQSARNPVERRMAPLSKDLVSVILPYEHFGTHLNSAGKTVNKDLEVKNFDKAGHVLANIWNWKVIDGHQVISEYVHPPSHPDCLIRSHETQKGSSDQSLEENGSDCTDAEIHAMEDFADIESEDSDNEDVIEEELPPRIRLEEIATNVSEEWKVIHVRQSQYLLQITKCFNTNCCAKPRTNILRFLPEKFLPAPVLYKSTKSGMQIAELGSSEAHFVSLTARLSLDFLKIPNELQPLPFDWFCPSLESKIVPRVCNVCGIYYPSKAALKTHSTLHSCPPKSNIQVEENIDNVLRILDDDDDAIFIIEDMDAWLSPAFLEIDV